MREPNNETTLTNRACETLRDCVCVYSSYLSGSAGTPWRGEEEDEEEEEVQDVHGKVYPCFQTWPESVTVSPPPRPGTSEKREPNKYKKKVCSSLLFLLHASLLSRSSSSPCYSSRGVGRSILSFLRFLVRVFFFFASLRAPADPSEGARARERERERGWERERGRCVWRHEAGVRFRKQIKRKQRVSYFTSN